jgi:hypothetical protein
MARKIGLIIIVLIVLSLTISLQTTRADGGATVQVVPQASAVGQGTSFAVNVTVTNVTNLAVWEFRLFYLNTILNCTNAVKGPFLEKGGNSQFFVFTVYPTYNATYGCLLFGSSLVGAVPGVNGSGTLATITFQSLAVGDTTLHFDNDPTWNYLLDATPPPRNPIPYTTVDGLVHVGFTLTVSVVGSGHVTLNETGPYNYGEVVSLTANPDIGWSFDHWSGNLTGSTTPATLIIIGNMFVNATFTQNTYTLNVSFLGNGVVNLNNSGPYHYGDSIQLIANASVGSVLQYWSGNLSGSANPATMTITGNSAVIAHFIQQPALLMSPASKTCSIYTENFTVAVNISNAVNVEDFKFEIHYNATLLNCTGVIWNAWGSGTYNLNATTGNITGSTSGAPINGAQTIVTIKFEASFYHIWRSAAGWTNNLTDTIYFQWANVSYLDGPDLNYQRGGGSNQFSVGSDFVYTFSPIQGDVNNDGTIDLYDLRTVAAYFGVSSNDTVPWINASKYDLNGDNVININDLSIIAWNFGYTY